jgi:hypothetical protein
MHGLSHQIELDRLARLAAGIVNWERGESAFGPKRTYRDLCYLAAFGGKADISQRLPTIAIYELHALVSSGRKPRSAVGPGVQCRASVAARTCCRKYSSAAG